jgi:hypothetical protein
MRVVAIEEHHIIPEMTSYVDLSWLPPAVQTRLRATTGERLADMDAAGIDWNEPSANSASSAR